MSRQHYQIACQRYFEATHHGNEVEGGLQHPNQYFQESQKILNGDVKDKSSGGANKSIHKVQTIYATLPAVKEEIKKETPAAENGDSDDDYNYSSLDVWWSVYVCVFIPCNYASTKVSQFLSQNTGISTVVQHHRFTWKK